jgi:hypothetical protein
MGKGLSAKNNGTHLAFAAGTGVLVFIDLVAHLIRKVTENLEEESPLDENFKLVLFASF